MEKRHAWYSETMNKQFGSAIYLNEKGEKIKVSDCSASNTPTECFSKWPDMQYVGIVTKFISQLSQT